MKSWILMPVFLIAIVALPLVPATAAPQPSDQAINDAVEDELQQDPALPPSGIDVTTNAGMVTLSGTVENFLAKDRAARIAETVKGVIGLQNKIAVKPGENVPDKVLASRVKNALLLNPATDRSDIKAEVSRGSVKLIGTAKSFKEKMMAEAVAKSLKGVTAVVNEIALSSPAQRSDQEIQSDIDQGLTWNALVNSGDITVEVKNGTVQLTGMVASAAERTLAVADAWVAGVTAVNATDLKVGGWNYRRRFAGDKILRKNDRDIQQALERVLRNDPLVHAFKIRTEVQDGAVTLRGTVDNLQAKRAAAAGAMTVAGVAWVNNRIKVAPGADAADEEIIKRVSNALSVDSYVSLLDVRTAVWNGIVTLKGSSDTLFDKMHAEAVVSSVKGVKAVDNKLRVKDVSSIVAADPYKCDYYDCTSNGYTTQNAHRNDRQITEEIKQELERSPFVDASLVTVAVDQGIATLSGTADSRMEAHMATVKAFEGGAREVINTLNIRSGN